MIEAHFILDKLFAATVERGTQQTRAFLPVVSMCAFLVGCASQPINAMEWSCRNMSVEISCQGQNCTVALPGDYTPMELTFDSSGGLSLCAYSGCWSGKAADISSAGNYFSITALGLPWSGKDGASADISATINTQTGIATLLTPDFAHPMSCKAP